MSDRRRPSHPPDANDDDSVTRDASAARDSNAPDASTLRALTEALAAQGRLIAETPDEVRAQEHLADDPEFALPPHLAEFEYRAQAQNAPTSNVIALETRRTTGAKPVARVWPGYVAGFGLGAAAATVFWVTTQRPVEPPPSVGGAGTELRTAPTAEAPQSYQLQLTSSCETCCGGAACKSAKDPAVGNSCASGRQCISCDLGSEKNAYKLRISAVGFTEEGRHWAETHGGSAKLQVCAALQGNALGCRGATEEPGDLLEWSTLPVATTTGQLLGGLRLDLRPKNAAPDAPALASWATPVTVTADTLCRGLSARLNAQELNIGRVSVFFDDPYYVELARAASVSELLLQKNRFRIAGDDVTKVFETTNSGDQTFALVFGPADRASAEKVRWQLLDQNLNAPIVLGADYRGQPRPR